MVLTARKKKVISNVFIPCITKIIYLLIAFFSRKIFLDYISLEYLGLNSLFSNILSMLNLAELGIGVAFHAILFKPLVDKDEKKIANILSLANKVYLVIAGIVLVVGLPITAFLNVFIKNNTLPFLQIQIAYIISVVGIALSYICASKRLYFESDEKYFVTSLTDLIIKTLGFVVSIFIIIFVPGEELKFQLYLAVISIQTVLSNVFMALLYFKRKGIINKDLLDKSIQKEQFKFSLKKLKDIIPSKLGLFIYLSTDSIIISSFLGLADVGKYSNYMLIFTNLFSLSALVANALESTFGKMIQEGKPKEQIYKYLKTYSDFQFLFALITGVCCYCLAHRFIKLWLGDSSLLISETCVILLSFDYFIHCLYQPQSCLYVPEGLLKEDKICTLISLTLNIVLSLILVNFIGLAGVIVGTLASDLFVYFTRHIWLDKKRYGVSSLSIIGTFLFRVAIFAFFSFGICHVCNLFLKQQNVGNFFIIAAIGLVFTCLFSFFYAYLKGYKNYLKKIFIFAYKVIKYPFKPFLKLYRNHLEDYVIAFKYKNKKRIIPQNKSICYMCQIPANWEMSEPVFLEIKNSHPEIKQFLFVAPEENGKDLSKFFIEIGQKYNVDVYFYKKNLLKNLKPTFVIYNRNYNVNYPKDIRNNKVRNFAYIVHIPYGYSIMNIQNISLNKDFSKNVDLFFADTKGEKEYFDKMQKVQINKQVQFSFYFGYPYLERCMKVLSEIEGNNILFKNNGRINVTWTPRWTDIISAGGTPHFKNYHKDLFDFFLNNPKYNFAFRPHPMLYDYHIKNKIFSKEYFENLKNDFEHSDNSFIDSNPDYLQTFAETDILISDSSSIVPTYFITGKRLIFCHSKEENLCSDFLQYSKYMKNAYSLEDIFKFLEEYEKENVSSKTITINDGVQEMKENQIGSIKKIGDTICQFK